MQKILIIEDDASVRNAIMKFLQAANFEVISAADGEAGMRLALEHEPDLIVCDAMMPELTGDRVLQLLRANERTQSIPFLVLVTRNNNAELPGGMIAGVDDVLVKPFTRDGLLRAIARQLSQPATILESPSTTGPAPYRQRVEHMTQSTYCDPLTDLHNRTVLLHQLRQALLQDSPACPSVAFICLHFDQLTALSQQHGFNLSDRLMRQMSDRLVHSLPLHYTVARTGIDAFGVLIPNRASAQALLDFAQYLQHHLTQPYQIGTTTIHLPCALGIACNSFSGTKAEELMHQARLAAHLATQQDCSIQLYTPPQEKQAPQQETLVQALYRALDQREFFLEYQPQVNLMTGRIIAAEALLRWQHPQRGVLYPPQFLSVADDIGVLVPIGEWVLQTACRQAETWQAAAQSPINVGVNLSSRQFHHPQLVTAIAHATAQSSLNPSLLMLDLTESTLMHHWETSRSTLEQLKQVGICINIDDFGTGLSSLNYLHQLPIHYLKIDPSFIRGIVTSTKALNVARAIVAMAQNLHIRTTAEGVEAREQVALLRQIGCYSVQGNLFSPSVGARDLEEMLLTDKRI
ncbi:MAG: EAL domain-containing protein [Kaiparowitsia implicata GSE-PSE-MK54-09C]|nr:EAL domain-containing protein [Kaiparowitsia implicata GSE-PSE-MK54-09C]